MPSFAHISDLHFGSGHDVEARTHALVSHLLAADIDHVLCTGDITHRGREEEFEGFIDVFAPLLQQGRLTLVPGNHDRCGDDVADSVMKGRRVLTRDLGALFVVQVDSTGPHNRQAFCGHGLLTPTDLLAFQDALAGAREDQLVVTLMHHHPYPLPEEGAIERLSRWVGLPFTDALHSGVDVLEAARGRCDIILHGHRHVATHRLDRSHPRPLAIYNAGATVEQSRYRVFKHRGRRLTAPPQWRFVTPQLPRRVAL
ncbi:MAG: metallophosphoesterase family protein [Nannocystales bacterium]